LLLLLLDCGGLLRLSRLRAWLGLCLLRLAPLLGRPLERALGLRLPPRLLLLLLLRLRLLLWCRGRSLRLRP